MHIIWTGTCIKGRPVFVRKSRRTFVILTAVRCTEGRLALPEKGLRHLSRGGEGVHSPRITYLPLYLTLNKNKKKNTSTITGLES